MNLSDLVMQFDLSDHAKKLTEQFGQGQAIDPGHFVGNFNKPPPIDPGHQVRPQGVGQQAAASVQGYPGVVNDMLNRAKGKPPLMRTARDKARRMR